MLVSLAGLIGACCRVSLLLWVYLFVMFLLIVLLFCFTIFAFVVTNKGAGQVVSGKGYKEYRLGDYSNWLQKRVNNTKNWNKIKSCLIDGKVCSDFNEKYLNDTVNKLYTEHLSAIQVISTIFSLCLVWFRFCPCNCFVANLDLTVFGRFPRKKLKMDFEGKYWFLFLRSYACLVAFDNELVILLDGSRILIRFDFAIIKIQFYDNLEN